MDFNCKILDYLLYDVFGEEDVVELIVDLVFDLEFLFEYIEGVFKFYGF